MAMKDFVFSFLKPGRAVGLVAAGVSFFSAVAAVLPAQPAFRLPRFTQDEELTQEVSLWASAAIPLGNTARWSSVWNDYEGRVAQGAGLGGTVGFGYHYFPIPQFFIGVDADAFWLSYPYKTLELPAADSYLHVGWGVYALSASIGARIPLGLYGLYFTTRVGIGYGLACSPSVTAVEKVTVQAGEEGKTKVRRRYIGAVSSSVNGNVFLKGGFGVEYRFRQHWIAKAGVDYSYMPGTALGSDQYVPEKDPEARRPEMIPLSALTVGIGISYAF